MGRFLIALLALATTAAHADPGAVCREAGDFAIWWDFSDLERLCSKLEPADLERDAVSVARAITQSCSFTAIRIAPWVLAESSKLAQREAGLAIQLKLAAAEALTTSSGTELSDGQLSDALDQDLATTSARVRAALTAAASASDAPYPDGLSQRLAHRLADAPVEHEQKEREHEARAAAPVLCHDYANSRGCARALPVVIAMVNPVQIANRPRQLPDRPHDPTENENMSLGLVRVVHEVLTDPTYSRGLALTALKLLDATLGERPPASHLFDDLAHGFEAAGLDETTARSHAWAWLGLYGVRGASFALLESLVEDSNRSVLVASEVIASSMGVLDALTASEGHPYSLPESVTARCSYGKPYHFWLAAYLTQTLVTHGATARGAVFATHLAGLGYEYESRTGGRVRYDKVPPSESRIYDDSIRLNIAFNDAGAVYGALGSNHTLDLDGGVDALLAGHEPGRWWHAVLGAFSKNVRGYYRFRDHFAPDAALDGFLAPLPENKH